MFDEVFFYVLIALCQTAPFSDQVKTIDEVYGSGQYYYTKSSQECRFDQNESMEQALVIELMAGEALVTAGPSFNEHYDVQIGGASKSNRNAQTISVDGMAINIHQNDAVLTLFNAETDTLLARMTK